MKKIFFSRKVRASFVILFFLIVSSYISTAQTSDTYDYTGSTVTFTVPSCVTSITVEVWGGGGKGSTITSIGGGAGGGGGAYAMSTFTVSPGAEYDLYVGAGSSTTSPGEDSWFNSSTTLLAKGGLSAADNYNDQGIGCQTGSIGDLIYIGGYSAIGEHGTNKYGGGGGSSGGTSSVGDYPDNTYQTQSGGTVTGGGSGGDGATSAVHGLSGSVPGGGGGGGYRLGGSARAPGDGADGQIVITYTPATSGTWIGVGGDGVWETSSNWCGGTPDGSTDVVIPADTLVEITSSSPSSPAICNSLILNGGTLTVNPGTFLTVNGTLTNNGGTFRHLSDNAGIASVIFDSYSDSGTEDFEMYLTGGGGPNYAWHYIAVPGTMAKTAFTDVNQYNLLLWDESQIVDDDMQAWQWHDGYDGTTGFSTLYAKTGYNFYHTYASITIDLGTFTSLLSNLGTIDLQWTEDGKNLIGNSLTCSIAWDNVVKTENIRGAIYFTQDNGIVTYVNGTGSPPNSGVIPPLQGFFVKALADGESLDFTGAGVNVHGTVNRYKSKSIIPLIRLELQNEAKVLDETVIRFDYNATDAIDNNFDATKIFSESLDKPQIYTEINSEKFIINGINFPDESKSVQVSVKIIEAGNYKIKKTQLEGLDNYDLTLTDTYENTTINLEDIEQYSFSSEPGTFNDRFIFTISTITTGVDDVTLDNKKFNIYTYRDNLNIAPLSPEWDNVKADINIFDLTGRRIQSHSGMIWYIGETKQLGFGEPKGIYIVEIVAGTSRVVQKVSHR